MKKTNLYILFSTLVVHIVKKLSYKYSAGTPRSSSRNLENLNDSLGFLDIRDPEGSLNNVFPGSRILRKAKAHFRSLAFLNSGMTIGGTTLHKITYFMVALLGILFFSLSAFAMNEFTINEDTAAKLSIRFVSSSKTVTQTLTVEWENISPRFNHPTETKWDSTALDLWGCRQTQKLRQLAEGNFPTLTTLDLCCNDLGDDDMNWLSRCNCPSLNTLILANNKIGHHGAQLLSRSKFSSSLTILDLTDNDLGDEGLKPIVDNLYNIEMLILSKTGIGDPGARYLIAKHVAQREASPLKMLSLADNNITYEGAKWFFYNWLPNLTTLVLNSNKIGEGERGTFFYDFTIINEPGEQFLYHYSMKAKKTSSLVTLDLSNNNLQDHTVFKFLLPSIELLDLSDNQLSTDAIEQIIHSFTKLEVLQLNNNKIDDGGTEVLGGICIKAKSLKKLYLKNNPLMNQDVKEKLSKKMLSNGGKVFY